MGNSKRKTEVYWIWKEYLRSGRLAYLEEVAREDPSLLRPLIADGSLLEHAVEAGDAAAVQYLIALGAQVNPLFECYPYLHTAMEANHFQTEVVLALLEAGADPSAGHCSVTSLHRAALRGHADVIPALVKSGVDVNAQYQVDGEWTPLMEAAFGGHVETARELLKLGADVALRDRNGSTAADIAQQHGHSELARLLASRHS